MKLKAAVIGCGRIASGFDDDPKRKMIATHVGAYQHLKSIELAAICDIDINQAKAVAQKRGIKNYYADYARMLLTHRPDIVSVCTPPHTHADIVCSIARKKLARAIFCEKPIASSLKEAGMMIKACRQANIMLQIDHQRRFDQMHQALRKNILGHCWGRIQRANFYYSAGISNTGSHMFDLLRFMFGDAQWVQAYASANPSHKPEDPNLDGFIQFKSGLLASFQALDHKQYLIFELDCFFEKARVMIKHSGFDMDYYTVAASPYFSGYRELKKAPVPVKKDYERGFMVRGVEEIITSLNAGKPGISTGEDGARALELIELSLKSAKSGKRMMVSKRI